MTRLEKLQAAYRAKMEKLRELRKLDEPSAEQIETALTEAEDLTKQIDAEVRASALEAREAGTGTAPEGLGVNPDTRIEVVDNPIYRGGAAHALGAQLQDILVVGNPQSDPASVNEARSRLDQVEKRTRGIVEKNAKKEGRAAGTGMHTGVSSDGGFLLQGETSMELMTNGFNNSEVLRRCSNRTLTDSDFVEIIGIDETSRVAGSRGGGVRVYTTSELEAMTSSQTKLKKIRIEPKPLTGMFYASDKMLRNATFLGQEMRQLFGAEFAYKCQDLVIWGTGQGEPLGIMNAGCKVTVAKTLNQVAKTITTENVLQMESRITNDSSPGLVWLINRDTKPQIAQLTIVSADASTLLYKSYQNLGVRAADLNGIPCITIEQASTLGAEGDIMLVDFSQYITANKGQINEASSIHVKFEYNQTAFRFNYDFDGQPRWASALTPAKGSNTTSPAVTLAVRA